MTKHSPPVGAKFTVKDLWVSPGRNQNPVLVERMKVEVLGRGEDYWRGDWDSPHQDRLEGHTSKYQPGKGADWHVRFEDGRECRLMLTPKSVAKVMEIAAKKK